MARPSVAIERIQQTASTGRALAGQLRRASGTPNSKSLFLLACLEGSTPTSRAFVLRHLYTRSRYAFDDPISWACGVQTVRGANEGWECIVTPHRQADLFGDEFE